MTQPQFQLISREMLYAIDFLWSADAMFAPFHALHIYDEVVRQGNHVEIPVLEPVPATPRPADRFIRVEHDSDGQGHALIDDVWRSLAGEDCGLIRNVRDKYGDTVQHLAMESVSSFTLHDEALDFIETFEWNRLLEIHNDFERGEGGIASRTYGFSWYLSFGAVAISPGYRQAHERMARRGRVWEKHGLAGAISPGTLLPLSISQEEHDQICQAILERQALAQHQADANAARLAERLPGLGHNAAKALAIRKSMREALPAALAKMICTEAFIAYCDKKGLSPVFDGIDQRLEYRSARNIVSKFKRLAMEGEFADCLKPLYQRLVRRAYSDAINLVRNPEPAFGTSLAPRLFSRGFTKLHLFRVHNAVAQILAYRAKL